MNTIMTDLRSTLLIHHVASLHYIKFRVKNAIELQTLYKQYSNLETMETTPRINEILVWF